MNNRQTKKLKISVSLIIFGIIILVGIFWFSEFSEQLTLFALVTTLMALVWYAYDTHRIANQTIEGNLRPLILRSGFIESWESVKFSANKGRLEGKFLEFSILKNIAKDISGYIIINKKKHQLLFGNSISSKNIKDELLNLEKHVECRFEPNWGWMSAGTIINAIFESNKYEESKDENQIYLTYSDMEGNRYFTKENKNFSQNSGKL